MDNRLIYLLDSPIEGGMYHALCINVPARLQLDLQTLEPDSLASFERFFFENKSEIEMKYYVVDQDFAGILYLFGALFGGVGRGSVDVMVDVLDKVFISHSREDNSLLVSTHNQELLSIYLYEIEQELMSREEEDARKLVSRCHDLASTVFAQKPIRLPERNSSDDSIFSYVYDGLSETLQEWLKNAEKHEMHVNTVRPFNSDKNSLSPDIIEKEDGVYELAYLAGIGDAISKLIQKVTYEYDVLTDEDRSDFVNLWSLLVTTQYRGLLPSVYMRSVKEIVQS